MIQGNVKIQIMKRYLYAIAVFVALIGFTSCEKDDDSNTDTSEGMAKVIVDFYPMVNGEEIHIADRFETPQGYPADVTQLRFYLSNIKLNGSNGEIELSEIAFIDIREHITTLEFEVPVGSYDGIQFDLGVPSELNGTQNPDFSTSIFDANHPLSVSNGMYWGWAAGYRFFVVDGNCDTVPNASDILPMPFSFHTGMDTLYREIPVFNRSFNLGKNDVETLHFGIEMNQFFENGSEAIDLKVDRSFHGSFNQIDLGIKLANNSAAAFQLLN
jgi:hypothetical protein